MQRDTGAAAGRREVGARFIVHSYEEGAAKPRPYLRPPCGGQADEGRGACQEQRRCTQCRPYPRQAVDEGSSTLPGAEGDAIADEEGHRRRQRQTVKEGRRQRGQASG